jgi:hypothetical protein
LQHRGDHAHVIKIICTRIVATRIKLGEQENILIARHRRLKRGNGHFAAYEQGHNHTGENNDITQGKQGEEFHIRFQLLVWRRIWGLVCRGAMGRHGGAVDEERVRPYSVKTGKLELQRQSDCYVMG